MVLYLYESKWKVFLKKVLQLAIIFTVNLTQQETHWSSDHTT